MARLQNIIVDKTKPLAVFYAGTNGSGKSTLRDSEPFPGLTNIDPDAIARGINPENPRAVDLQAGRIAARQFQDAIAERKGFSMETTLTGRTVMNRIEKAKEAGFDVRLYYVGLDSAERNIDRVAIRVAKGGHHIDEADIRRRYTESHENLPRAMELANSGKIFSNDEKKHVIEYEFNNGIVLRKVQEPSLWAQEAIKAQQRHVEVDPVGSERQTNAKAASMADVFRRETPEKAVQQHPELAGAYGFVRACEVKAEAAGFNKQQRDIIMDQVRDNVAKRIERGDVPSVEIREERQRDPER